MNKKILLFLICLIFIMPVHAEPEVPSNLSCFIYFSTTQCPNCAVVDPIVLKDWVSTKNVVIIEYSFRGRNEENSRILEEYAQKYNTLAAVPQLFIKESRIISGRSILNFNPAMGSNPCLVGKGDDFNIIDLNQIQGNPVRIWSNGRMLERIAPGSVSSDFLRELLFSEDLQKTVSNPSYKIKRINSDPVMISKGSIEFNYSANIEDSWIIRFNENVIIFGNETEQNMIDMPIFGKTDITKTSLPVLSIEMGLADSLNPYTFFILIFLLAIMIFSIPRKRVLLMSFIFIIVSGIIQFLFMMNWIALPSSSGMLLLAVISGIIAGFAGIKDMRDFFVLRKVDIMKKDRKFIQKLDIFLKRIDVLPTLIIGTIIIAVTVNLYGLLYAAGLPVVYTKILALHHLSLFHYQIYTIFYIMVTMVIMVLLIIIFAIIMGYIIFTEEETLNTKLASGILAFPLGIILLINPLMLKDFFIMLVVFSSSVVASGIILYVKHSKGKNTSSSLETKKEF